MASKSSKKLDMDRKSSSDNQMDSGFISETNLLSSSSSLCADQESPKISNSQRGNLFQNSIQTESQSDHILDSGVDLSEVISGLNLSETEKLEDIIIQTPLNSAENIPLSINNSNNQNIHIENVEKNKLSHLRIPLPHLSILREIFRRDEEGNTQLHKAAMQGFEEVAFNMTRLLPHQALVDIQNLKGQTALHLAVLNCDERMSRHLIVCGASPVAKDYKGQTPLHIACRIGFDILVSDLISQIKVIEVMSARLLYPPGHTSGLLAADLFNYDGETCIHVSCQNGHKSILQFLTMYGADINSKDGKCGRTALHIAVEKRDVEMVRFLIEKCRAAVNVQNYSGFTPVQVALTNGDRAIVEELTKYGCGDYDVATYSSSDEYDEQEDSQIDCDSVYEDALFSLPYDSMRTPVCTNSP